MCTFFISKLISGLTVLIINGKPVLRVNCWVSFIVSWIVEKEYSSDAELVLYTIASF